MSEAPPTAGMVKTAQWDGTGTPRSKKAAIAWAKANGVPDSDIQWYISASSLKQVGDQARNAVTKRGARARESARSAASTPGGGGGSWGPGAGSKAGAKAAPNDRDLNKDGTVDAKDQQVADVLVASGQDPVDALGLGPIGEGASERLPLWSYDVSDLADNGASLRVRNRSAITGSVNGVRPDPDGMVGARYFADSARVPLGWSKEKISDTQRLLDKLGLYGKDGTTLGEWSPQDQKVFGTVLAYANQSGLTWKETIAEWTMVGLPRELKAQLAANTAAGPPPLSIKLANPADLKAVFKAAARSILGNGNLDEDTIARLTAAFQAEQTRAQTSEYNTVQAGGASIDAPDADVFAEEQVRALDPIKADARGAVKVASVIQRMMEGTMPAHRLPAEGG